MKPLFDISLQRPVRFPFRTFLSIVPVAGGYVGAFRECDPTVDWGALYSDVYFAEFDENGGLETERLLAIGNDPRVFLWGSTPYVLYLHDGQYTLSNFITSYLLKFDGFVGKNWMPVPSDDGLLFIRSLDPLCICRLEDDMKTVTSMHGDPHSDVIGEFRGGAAARLEADGRIVGWGHRTRRSNWHTPFHFEIDNQNQVKYTEVSGKFGSGVNDPTSFFGDKVLICHTPSHWDKVQPVVHTLYSV